MQLNCIRSVTTTAQGVLVAHLEVVIRNFGAISICAPDKSILYGFLRRLGDLLGDVLVPVLLVTTNPVERNQLVLVL